MKSFLVPILVSISIISLFGFVLVIKQTNSIVVSSSDQDSFPPMMSEIPIEENEYIPLSERDIEIVAGNIRIDESITTGSLIIPKEPIVLKGGTGLTKVVDPESSQRPHFAIEIHHEKFDHDVSLEKMTLVSRSKSSYGTVEFVCSVGATGKMIKLIPLHIRTNFNYPIGSGPFGNYVVTHDYSTAYTREFCQIFYVKKLKPKVIP